MAETLGFLKERAVRHVIAGIWTLKSGDKSKGPKEGITP